MNTHPSETCALVRAAVPLLVGDDLEPEALASARRHVEGCVVCARALERAREARAALAVLRVERPAPDVWGGVRAALAAEGRLSSAARPAPRAEMRAAPRRRAWRPLVASLAAAGLLSTALWGFLSLGDGAGSGDRTGEPERVVRGEPLPRPADLGAADPGALERGPERRESAPDLSRPVDRGLRLVSSGPGAASGTRVIPVRSAAPAPWAVEAEAECADLSAGDSGPQSLRPSSDQRPRRTVYFQPDGLLGESIDVRQLRRPNLPFGSRAGVQAAGGHE